MISIVYYDLTPLGEEKAQVAHDRVRIDVLVEHSEDLHADILTVNLALLTPNISDHIW